jgi:hypothetical protein
LLDLNAAATITRPLRHGRITSPSQSALHAEFRVLLSIVACLISVDPVDCVLVVAELGKVIVYQMASERAPDRFSKR